MRNLPSFRKDFGGRKEAATSLRPTSECRPLALSAGSCSWRRAPSSRVWEAMRYAVELGKRDRQAAYMRRHFSFLSSLPSLDHRVAEVFGVSMLLSEPIRVATDGNCVSPAGFWSSIRSSYKSECVSFEAQQSTEVSTDANCGSRAQ